jgi:hypothetical protein
VSIGVNPWLTLFPRGVPPLPIHSCPFVPIRGQTPLRAPRVLRGERSFPRSDKTPAERPETLASGKNALNPPVPRGRGRRSQLNPGHSQLRTVHSQLRMDHSQLRTGRSQLNPGRSQLRTDRSQLNPGHSQLNPGRSQLRTGRSQLNPPRSQSNPARPQRSPAGSQLKHGKKESTTDKHRFTQMKNQNPNLLSVLIRVHPWLNLFS